VTSVERDQKDERGLCRDCQAALFHAGFCPLAAREVRWDRVRDALAVLREEVASGDAVPPEVGNELASVLRAIAERMGR
jgi:hypothetical protein